jgi:carbamoyltransferase
MGCFETFTMDILGISAFYHDSAACLIREGQILAAAQEERFTRVKHDAGFPAHAARYCLEAGGIAAAQLDCVAFYDKPFLKFDRIMETYMAYAPAGLRSFMHMLPQWAGQKLRIPREIDRAFEGEYRGPIVFPAHHESHAASAFFPSPFEERRSARLMGWGVEHDHARGGGRQPGPVAQGDSLPAFAGVALYTAFTYYLGFKVNSGEYKVMGLAPYGDPKYVDLITEHLIDIRDDGSFWMDMRYFNYCQGLTMTSERFHRLFGGPPRQSESDLTPRHMDIAASLQVVTERVMLNIARHAREVTGKRNLCLAGGCALNCVANGVILRSGLFDGMFIQPAAGDAGGALGAALLAWHHIYGKPRQPVQPDLQAGSYLGPSYDDGAVCVALDGVGAKYHRHGRDEAVEVAARALTEEKVVGGFRDGWNTGRARWGIGVSWGMRVRRKCSGS